MNPGQSLRWALASNALFSTLCSLVLIFEPIRVGQWLGIQSPMIFRCIGVGLVLFAADLVHQASRSQVDTNRAIFSSVGDFLWVLVTLVLLVVFPGVLVPGGFWLVTDIALIVLVFGLWQVWASRRIRGQGAQSRLSAHAEESSR